jgi:hypothetical protein
MLLVAEFFDSIGQKPTSAQRMRLSASCQQQK